jgi:hypothetical protein
MALSMDEQRMLAEIERRLTADDPRLATCLTSFRRPGPATLLRSPRARIIGSLFTVLLVAVISLVVYAMIPFRGHATRPAATTSASTPRNTAITSAPGDTAISATRTGSPALTSTPPTAAGGSATAGAKPPGRSASPTAGVSAGASAAHQATGQAAFPAAASP